MKNETKKKPPAPSETSRWVACGYRKLEMDAHDIAASQRKRGRKTKVHFRKDVGLWEVLIPFQSPSK